MNRSCCPQLHAPSTQPGRAALAEVMTDGATTEGAALETEAVGAGSGFAHAATRRHAASATAAR
ncbi:MAG: hypothetical protein JOY78_07245 [Pseudonocardia sp.]|nr:hypothetical protein [Pseudonocardia sp.]